MFCPKTRLQDSPIQECSTSVDDIVVGFDDDILTILDRTTGSPPCLDIVSIVGMGGIGKTTIARRVYDDPLIKYHFHIRGWVTVSQDYLLREVLISLLHCTSVVTDDTYEKDDEELAEELYQSLKCRKFLIVMDDMWIIESWNQIKRFFPDDKNGSRILLTTRLKDLAIHANSSRPPHNVKFLDIDNSWKLLHQKVFVNELCPRDLVGIGMQISGICQGLPLAIVVIAGLLSKASKSRESWIDVANNIHSFMCSNLEQCLGILSLSYKNLPDHLRACFLYMAAFPENTEILTWRLIRLWIAEGFLKPDGLRSCEVLAEEYLADLADRNLILVERRTSLGKIKTCRIHGILRDFCLREAHKINFLDVLKLHSPIPMKSRKIHRRISLHSTDCLPCDSIDPSISVARSFLYFGINTNGPNMLHESLVSSVNFKQLRVLEITSLQFYCFPVEVTRLVTLRYIALTAHYNVPASLTRLMNLETLIIKGRCSLCLPRKIWTMDRLRHLHFKTWSYFPSPVGSGPMAFGNLQTLSRISPSSCSKELFAAMPNLIKLGVCGEETCKYVSWIYCLANLIHLHRLEVLKLCFDRGKRLPWIPHAKIFPSSLKKLTLVSSYWPWRHMAHFSMLLNLEVLKLRKYAFTGNEWLLNDEVFHRLKFLLVEDRCLRRWEATTTNFPRLQELVLKSCVRLKEIPVITGEIPTLRVIKLINCSNSAQISAKLIQEEQRSVGNYDLDIVISSKSQSVRSMD